MQKLLIPFEMRGYQGVYNLEKKVHFVKNSEHLFFLCFEKCLLSLSLSVIVCLTLGQTYVAVQIYEPAVRGLTPVQGPLPVKFPIPDPRDQFSLKPGSISVHFPESKSSEVERSSNLNAAIAGARAAATQFSKKDQNFQTAEITTPGSIRTRSKSKLLKESETSCSNFNERSDKRNLTSNNKEKISGISYDESNNSAQPP